MNDLHYVHGLSIENIQSLGYNWVSSSGDPHVFPLHGSMYELPQTPGMYRMLQGDDLIIMLLHETFVSLKRMKWYIILNPVEFSPKKIKSPL